MLPGDREIMVTRRLLVKVAQFVWFFLSFMGIIGIYTGNAEPLVSPGAMPAGGTADAGVYMIGVAAAVSIGGVVVLELVSPSKWESIADETDLTLEGSGMLGGGTFTGTVRGRSVRARTEKRNTGQSTEGGTNKATFTVTEADLSRPAEEGLAIGLADGERGATGFGDINIDTTVVDGNFVVANADSEPFARELITREVREALTDLQELDSLTVGSMTDVVMDEMMGADDSMVGGLIKGQMEKSVDKNLGGSAGTVAIETKGRLGDPEELDRRIAAVAAVADAFEVARAGKQ